jgi:hypothetical protein
MSEFTRGSMKTFFVAIVVVIEHLRLFISFDMLEVSYKLGIFCNLVLIQHNAALFYNTILPTFVKKRTKALQEKIPEMKEP